MSNYPLREELDTHEFSTGKSGCPFFGFFPDEKCMGILFFFLTYTRMVLVINKARVDKRVQMAKVVNNWHSQGATSLQVL